MTTNASELELRIAKMARRAAKVVIALRREGDPTGAARFEAAAMDVAEQMRKAHR